MFESMKEDKGTYNVSSTMTRSFFYIVYYILQTGIYITQSDIYFLHDVRYLILRRYINTIKCLYLPQTPEILANTKTIKLTLPTAILFNAQKVPAYFLCQNR